METMPEIVLFAGPNGAGKSTFARFALPEAMPFVNADEIAKTLPESFTGNAELEAGRLLIARVEQLMAQRKSFALETTLASRSLAPRIAALQQMGYQFRLLFLWLPSADLARARVAARVRRGGHAIPDATIARRFGSGLQNFFMLYRPLADNWFVFDNTRLAPPQLIARGGRQMETTPYNTELWEQIQRQRGSFFSEPNTLAASENAATSAVFEDPDELTRRFGVAVREALLDNKRAVNSVAVWGSDGKVAIMPPDKIATNA